MLTQLILASCISKATAVGAVARTRECRVSQRPVCLERTRSHEPRIRYGASEVTHD